MTRYTMRVALCVLSGLAFAGAPHAQEATPGRAAAAATAASDAAPAPAPARRSATRLTGRARAMPVALDVSLAPDAKVDPELETACKFEEIVATDVSKALHHKRLGGFKPTGTDARLLQVKITDVSGESGGVYTGTKSIRVHVSLIVDGKLADETEFYRYNTGGNPFRGTCHIFRQHTKRLGRDMAGWLRDENYKAEETPMSDKDEADE